MPVLIFYAYRVVGHKRIALGPSLNEYPTDWLHMKSLVKECMIELFNEFHADAALMTLEHCLKGKYITKSGGVQLVKRGTYKPARVRYKRDIIWSGKVEFNPKTEAVVISQCSFGPPLYLTIAPDYYEEKGVKYRSAPLIPKLLPKPGDPKGLLMDPSPSRYADYSRQPHGPYDFQEDNHKRRRQYEPFFERTYLPEDLRVQEEEEQEKED